MKKILLTIAIVVCSISSFAQNDVTKFMGIPVDGSKSAMIQKLKGKGFTYHQTGDYLSGRFNGYDVKLCVLTENNKVYRIGIEDATACNESEIKIRFNRLVGQFEKNDNYEHILGTNQYIPEEEDISHEMTFNSKRYEASFFQRLNMSGQDSIQFVNNLRNHLLKQFTEEQIQDTTKTVREQVVFVSMNYYFDLISKKNVWFMINEEWGNYKILMFYDNKKNQADGEDL